MKIVYIAHPIGGDQQGNMKKIGSLIRYINLTYDDIVPAAPYMSDLIAMRDDIPEERARGFKNNEVYFKMRLMHELWICGKVSAGVAQEIDWANQYDIPVKMMTDLWGEMQNAQDRGQFEFGAPMFPYDEFLINK